MSVQDSGFVEDLLWDGVHDPKVGVVVDVVVAHGDRASNIQPDQGPRGSGFRVSDSGFRVQVSPNLVAEPSVRGG